VGDKVAGMTRSAGGLTFATFFNAGHMVCVSRFYRVLGVISRLVASRYHMTGLGSRWRWFNGGWQDRIFDTAYCTVRLERPCLSPARASGLFFLMQPHWPQSQSDSQMYLIDPAQH
jgi:hypothetical protein